MYERREPCRPRARRALPPAGVLFGSALVERAGTCKRYTRPAVMYEALLKIGDRAHGLLAECDDGVGVERGVKYNKMRGARRLDAAQLVDLLRREPAHELTGGQHERVFSALGGPGTRNRRQSFAYQLRATRFHLAVAAASALIPVRSYYRGTFRGWHRTS